MIYIYHEHIYSFLNVQGGGGGILSATPLMQLLEKFLKNKILFLLPSFNFKLNILESQLKFELALYKHIFLAWNLYLAKSVEKSIGRLLARLS